MKLRGEWSETIQMSTSGTMKDYLASVGLKGFFLCEIEDAVTRTKFLEAAALGNVLELDAYREHGEVAGTEEDEDWS
jgi:hypothetical protein